MEGLCKCTAAAQEHLHAICEFSLNRPMRAKVDRQSYDELKPGVDRALAVYTWSLELQQHFVSTLNEQAKAESYNPDSLSALAEALDACIVLENQFLGWSACINRFSWFKRTFQQIQREVAKEVSVEQLNADIGRFQTFISTCLPSMDPATSCGLRSSSPPSVGFRSLSLALVHR
jgi:hypothetical protein